MRAAAKAALAAYAEPIRRHAREWAATVLKSILRDIEARVSFDVAAEVAGVNSMDELDSSQALDELDVLEGARAWAQAVWHAAFVHEIERLAREHETAAAGRGDAFVRQHLRDLEARRV